ncbi:MAG: FAD:protein FMN transferase [Planctomycetia bacterium]|nr:FAD:protein FMN transferase [Planctomycetia bacterium]
MRWEFVLLLLLLVLPGVSCDSEHRSAVEPVRIVTLSGETMGTFWNARLLCAESDGETVAQMRHAIETALAQVDAVMSTWREDSELSRFNQAESTEWISVSPELASVVACGLTVSQASRGAFDMTVGPVVNLWKFGPDRTELERLPTDAELSAAKERVGYEKLSVRMEPPALRKAIPDLYVDLSAIAKGYAVDCVAAVLQQSGVENFMIDVGGELRCRGHKRTPSGEPVPWSLGIEVPDLAANTNGTRVGRILETSDLSLATSGDYRNYRRVGKVQFSHLIDPRSGRPCALFETDEDVEERVASVSVVAKECMEADAWATALFVLGPEEGIAVAGEDLAVLFIVRTVAGGKTSYREVVSPAFEREVNSRKVGP